MFNIASNIDHIIRLAFEQKRIETRNVPQWPFSGLHTTEDAQ